MRYIEADRDHFAAVVRTWCEMFKERHDFVRTFTGKKWYHNAPEPDDVDFRDIAHALSNITRYTGHLNVFYSVAEHSVRVSRLVPRCDAKEALLHDAAEAYLNDLSRPFKRSPGMEVYKYYEAITDAAIETHFGIRSRPDSVTYADTVCLFWEKRDLFSVLEDKDIDWHTWAAAKGPCNLEDVPPQPLIPWSAARAEVAFTQRWEDLGGKL
jgi:hypothetical protein